MKVDLAIRQGATFTFVFRWETLPVVYKAITNIDAAAPVRITAPGHGLVTGWRAAVTSVLGMEEINAANSPPRESQYHVVTVIDSDEIEFNAVNAALFTPYTSGGVLQYNTPTSLAGFDARMKVRDKIGGTLLVELDVDGGQIELDDTEKTIILRLSAAETEAFTFVRGVYDLELVSPTDEVTALAEGVVRVSKEITTPA